MYTAQSIEYFQREKIEYSCLISILLNQNDI